MKIVYLLTTFLIFACANGKMKSKINSDQGNENQELKLENIWEKIDLKSQEFIENSKVYSTIDSMPKDFIEFYERFISDSNFQKEHIKFPILAVIGECDSTILLDSKNWEIDKWDFRENFYDPQDSNLIYQNESKFYFKNIRKDVGKIFEIGFEKHDGIWYLTLYDVNVC